MKKYFVFDVESIGLHGEAFAVGGGLFLENGSLLWQFCFGVDRKQCQGRDSDRSWVETEIAPIEVTHDSPLAMRFAFWEMWKLAKRADATLAADCLWPVEANFLSQCVRDVPEERNWEGPYPFLEISTILTAAGKDPIGKIERLEGELPIHNPLADARQSARVLCETLRELKDDSWIDRAGKDIETRLIDCLAGGETAFVRGTLERAAKVENVAADFASIIRKVKGGAA